MTMLTSAREMAFLEGKARAKLIADEGKEKNMTRDEAIKIAACNGYEHDAMKLSPTGLVDRLAALGVLKLKDPMIAPAGCFGSHGREFDPDVIHRAKCNADAPYDQETCVRYPWAAAARIRHLEYTLSGFESVPSLRADIALNSLFGDTDLSYGSVKEKRDRLELFLRGAGLKIVEKD